VELYDTLKHIIQGHGSTDNLAPILEGQRDIEHHLLHFLENHDEQRIASAEFAGNPKNAMPAMVLSATISSAPTMIYFGQEVGEPGAEDAGFGKPSRTSIFDYIGVPHYQRWVNDLKFDGGQLSIEEKELRDFYQRLLNFTLNHPAMLGEYREIHSYNRQQPGGYNHRVFSFLRFTDQQKLLIVCNFDPSTTQKFDLVIPEEVLGELGLAPGTYSLKEQLYGKKNFKISIDKSAVIPVELHPLESLLLSFETH